MPLYSRPPLLPYQWEFLCLPSPVTDVEIIENTLPSLSLSLIWVWIRSSSLDSQGCLTYSKCSRWFKKYSSYLWDTKCNNLYKILPSLNEVLQSAALCMQANNGSIIYLPLTRVGYSLNKIPQSFFSSLNSLTLYFHCAANPFISICLYPRRLDNDSGVLY